MEVKAKNNLLGKNGFNMTKLNDKVNSRGENDVDIFLSNNEYIKSPCPIKERQGKLNRTMDMKDAFKLSPREANNVFNNSTGNLS